MSMCMLLIYIPGNQIKKRLLRAPLDLDVFVILFDHSGHCFLLSAFFVFFYWSYVFTKHQFRYLCAPISRRESTVVCLMGKVRFLGEQLLHVPHFVFEMVKGTVPATLSYPIKIEKASLAPRRGTWSSCSHKERTLPILYMGLLRKGHWNLCCNPFRPMTLRFAIYKITL